MKARWLFVALLLIPQGCGGGGQPSNTSCGPQDDNVTARFAVIQVANATVQPPGCQVVGNGTQIVALSGGTAEARFGSDAVCKFYQLTSSSGSSSLKTAYFWTRDPSGALFRMTNGGADCTVASALMAPLCGQATLYPDGSTTIGVHIDCNNDPVVNVAVYRGGATLITGGLPAPDNNVHLTAGDAASADLSQRTLSRGPAQFTPEQISLFEVQRDALLGRVMLTDGTSLLKVKSLSPSDYVLAPNNLQAQFGKNYGSIRLMCSALNVPVIFFPADPYANTPRLLGGVCGTRIARVYGVAIYSPVPFAPGGQFFTVTGGELIRSEIFQTPVNLEFGSPRQLFPWDGSLSSSPAPRFASRAIYVVKVLYDLPPDTTPRIGLVAVSLFGAPYPVIG